ncbi:hypothetical protein WAI453_003237 [Rhynchosporium graminicola]
MNGTLCQHLSMLVLRIWTLGSRAAQYQGDRYYSEIQHQGWRFVSFTVFKFGAGRVEVMFNLRKHLRTTAGLTARNEQEMSKDRGSGYPLLQHCQVLTRPQRSDKVIKIIV